MLRLLTTDHFSFRQTSSHSLLPSAVRRITNNQLIKRLYLSFESAVSMLTNRRLWLPNESMSVEAGRLIVWLCIYTKLIGVRTRQGRRWLQHFTANNNATLRHNCCRSLKMIWEAAPPVFWPPAVMTFSLLNNPTIIVSFSYGFSERISSLEGSGYATGRFMRNFNSLTFYIL